MQTGMGAVTEMGVPTLVYLFQNASVAGLKVCDLLHIN